MDYYRAKDKDEWLLIETPYELINGDTAYEIRFCDIPDIVGTWFFGARRFWNLYRQFGLPNVDWRKLTIQQMSVIETFNACFNSYKEKNVKP